MRRLASIGALLLSPLVHANLIENGGFEVGGPTSVAGLSTHNLEGTFEFKVDTENPHGGARCIGITAPQKGWARWYSIDVFLLKGAQYRLSCWVRSAPGQTAAPGSLRGR